MILILGGTTEGRIAVQTLEEAGSPFYYSTRGSEQDVALHHGIRLQGSMDVVAMEAFCQSHNIRLMVDAAHPFAEELHRTVAAVAGRRGIPVVRLERIYPRHEDADIVWCADFDEAIRRVQADGVGSLLCLTGVQTIGRLRPLWANSAQGGEARGGQGRELGSGWGSGPSKDINDAIHPDKLCEDAPSGGADSPSTRPSCRCHFRILDRESSRALARQEGFPEACLHYYRQGEDERRLMGSLRPDAILTKESGLSGGFGQKVDAAQELGIRVYAIRRPALPTDFHTVDGPHGLRRAVERLLPTFYPLHSGLTTGTCAAAAAVAAARSLLEVMVSMSPRAAQPVLSAQSAQSTLPAQSVSAQPTQLTLSAQFTQSVQSAQSTPSVASAQAPVVLPTPPSAAPFAQVPVTLPNGETILVDVESQTVPVPTHHCDGSLTLSAQASVIKDAGDDPDITNGMTVCATVTVTIPPASTEGTAPTPASTEGAAPTPTYPQEANAPLLPTSEDGRAACDYNIAIAGGPGIGTVTLPGLGLPVGGPAINETPQRMIKENVLRVLHGGHAPCGRYEVCISVPGGETVAQRTFNPRIGVVGGISIIGTSGIVKPFSAEAFVSSIRKSMAVAKATGADRVVINSGAKSERYLHDRYPDLPPQAFVHYGNFIGETLQIAAELGIRRLTLGLMIGKAVKLAEGQMDTHSKHSTMNRTFIQSLAREAGCSARTQEDILSIGLARELWTLLPAEEMPAFCRALIAHCYRHCAPLLPQGELTILLITDDGQVIAPDAV